MYVLILMLYRVSYSHDLNIVAYLLILNTFVVIWYYSMYKLLPYCKLAKHESICFIF